MEFLSKVSPLFYSVNAKSRKDYHDWLHLRDQKPLVIFPGYPRLELLTRTAWWIAPLYWVCALLVIYTTGCYRLIVPSTEEGSLSLMAGVIGSVSWLPTEYAIHRWLFHSEDIPNIVHFILHGLHHKCPSDSYRLVFPPVVSTLLACIIWPLSRALLFFTSTLTAYSFFCGLVLGYCAYESIHYAVHHLDIEQLSLLKNNHLAHHSSASAPHSFGVTNTLLDALFKTRMRPGRISVSK